MTFPTPYDGSSKLFQIGTRPLDPALWLEPDAQLGPQIREKERLLSERRTEVFAALPESEAAQAELLALLADYLSNHHPSHYRREGDSLAIAALNERRPLVGEEPDLIIASRLVQDDLLILQRGAEAWRLTAASLCFPSSWLLSEKIGQPLDAIHTPVPGFGPGTRAAQLMARMFDAARPETPMIRWNYSLYGDTRLFHPDVVGPQERRFGSGDRADPVVMRVERQTIHKLPKTGAMVFTIRISLDPINKLLGHPRQSEIANALINQIETLTLEQLDYKGLTLEAPRVLSRLRELL